MALVYRLASGLPPMAVLGSQGEGEAESPDVWGRTGAMPLWHILGAGQSHETRPDTSLGWGWDEAPSPWKEMQSHLAEGQHAG